MPGRFLYDDDQTGPPLIDGARGASGAVALAGARFFVTFLCLAFFLSFFLPFFLSFLAFLGFTALPAFLASAYKASRTFSKLTSASPVRAIRLRAGLACR